MAPTWSAPTTLDRAACSKEETVEIVLTPYAAALHEGDADLDVFFDSDGNCQGDPPDASETDLFIADMTIPADGAFLTSGASLDFPDDIEDDNDDSLIFTTADVHNDVPDACTDSRQSRTSFALCVTVDKPSSLTTGPNGTIEYDDGDWYAWVRFTVDTMPPPAPDEPTVMSLDGRLRLSAEVTATGETDDIAKWRARTRPLDDSTAGEASDDWSEYTHATTSDAGTSATIVISAQSGVTYEACVTAIDIPGDRAPRATRSWAAVCRARHGTPSGAERICAA